MLRKSFYAKLKMLASKELVANGNKPNLYHQKWKANCGRKIFSTETGEVLLTKVVFLVVPYNEASWPQE